MTEETLHNIEQGIKDTNLTVQSLSTSVKELEKKINLSIEKLAEHAGDPPKTEAPAKLKTGTTTDTSTNKTGAETDTDTPANKTSEYIAASAYAAGLIWANPDLRTGVAQFLPLAPAVLSLADDGLNKAGGKRALIPALVGIGSVLAAGRLFK